MVVDQVAGSIGIPRSILHYEFDGAIANFLEQLEISVVLSPETNQSIFRDGKRLVLDELCFPIKVFMGHVATLAKTDVERILIPVLVGHESNQVFPCHMRTRLADIVVALGICGRDRVLSPSFRFDESGLTATGFNALGKALGFSQDEIDQALQAIVPLKQTSHPISCEDGGLTIAILGHPYVVEDPWVNGYIIPKLRTLGCNTQTACRQGAAVGYCPDGTGLHFDLAARTLTMARLWDSDSNVDGIVFLLPFNCGPDGDIARHMVQTTHTPMLTLVLDELQSGAGMLTRLEAFVDLLSQSAVLSGV